MLLSFIHKGQSAIQQASSRAREDISGGRGLGHTASPWSKWFQPCCH